VHQQVHEDGASVRLSRPTLPRTDRRPHRRRPECDVTDPADAEVARWFAALDRALAVSDAAPDDTEVADEERRLLLDLARIAAHGSQRWTAPITTYLVGRGLAGSSAEERLRVLRSLVADLDT
jgi:hypothetical protein